LGMTVSLMSAPAKGPSSSATHGCGVRLRHGIKHYAGRGGE